MYTCKSYEMIGKRIGILGKRAMCVSYVYMILGSSYEDEAPFTYINLCTSRADLFIQQLLFGIQE